MVSRMRRGEKPQSPGLDVHGGFGKIRQTSGMVEMQARHQDVGHRFRGVSQPPDLMDGGNCRILDPAEDSFKEFLLPGRRLVIPLSQSGVDQEKPVFRPVQDARPPRAARETAGAFLRNYESSRHGSNLAEAGIPFHRREPAVRKPIAADSSSAPSPPGRPSGLEGSAVCGLGVVPAGLFLPCRRSRFPGTPSLGIAPGARLPPS